MVTAQHVLGNQLLPDTNPAPGMVVSIVLVQGEVLLCLTTSKPLIATYIPKKKHHPLKIIHCFCFSCMWQFLATSVNQYKAMEK